MGDLGEDEQSRLEASLRADEYLFEELLMAEEDLLDDYARNELSERDRKRIERYFLKPPARRERLIFSRTLMRYCAEQPPCAQPESAAAKRLSWWYDLISFFGLRV